jgi:hypothetical protein
MAASKARKEREPLQESLAVEEQVFRSKRDKLLRHYSGEFVALRHGRVVGHGADDEELARRMFEKFGDVPFYIAKVEREPTVYELPSPVTVR